MNITGEEGKMAGPGGWHEEQIPLELDFLLLPPRLTMFHFGSDFHVDCGEVLQHSVGVGAERRGKKKTFNQPTRFALLVFLMR
jgi:hypothetical protein